MKKTLVAAVKDPEKARCRRFERGVVGALEYLLFVVHEESERYPPEQYPARGTVLRMLERRLGEVLPVAKGLHKFPPERGGG